MEEQIYGILFKEGRLRPPLSQNDQLFDHGLDSPGVVDVMMALEETFDVSFPDELLNRRTFSTISSIANAIKKIKGIA